MNNENNFFSKLKNSLVKTKNNFSGKIDQLINYSGVYDDEFFEELEEILILADLGVETTNTIINKTRERIQIDNIKDKEKVKSVIKEIVREILIDDEVTSFKYPMVILVVGVNGVGKTTTIAKLANLYKKQGKKVLLAAGDTFRAAAVEQITIWSQRLNIDIIRNDQGADPASVIYDALQAAKARKTDVLICDTAGRLHNKDNLMSELSKINRVIANESEFFTQYNLLVLDATSGTNAVNQANVFNQATKLDGIVLTKLDGTSKGGIVIPIKSQLKIPIHFIGVGEQMDDLQEFDASTFVDALF
ncbi:signal recognition particle-docking protein FtsY [Alkalibaculum sp. M08DMB]|uniref:Signal recognition particle receptor FtsY n=1 Tax=Alkalibaculum sporogenes TaxID=2655001 RepID=A0A6A7K9I6_9FIRM|nr:signal recognition particle-docking protein FtsY [Alkalibaculum sporogenes]MPW26056.1 signal recognition particle-docking protein FtsY [Alkalibaculum sporogenes]